MICCSAPNDTERGSDAATKRSHSRSACNQWPAVRCRMRNFHDSAHRLHDRYNTCTEQLNRLVRVQITLGADFNHYPSSQEARHFPFCSWSVPKHSVQWSILSHWAQACGHGRQNWMCFESSDPASSKVPWGQTSKQEPRCMVRLEQWVHWVLDEPLHSLHDPWQG
jgi:hypothetical protein